MSDTGWARIARFIVPSADMSGRPCPPERWREYLNAATCVLCTGCAWRHLPHDFAMNWSAAHKHFLRWWPAGLWIRILTAIRGEIRTRSSRRRRLSAAAVNFSSVTASPVAGPRGFDAAKEIDGVERHVLVDSAGILLAAVLTPADVQDRATFPELLRKAKRIAPTTTQTRPHPIIRP